MLIIEIALYCVTWLKNAEFVTNNWEELSIWLFLYVINMSI